MSDRAPTPAGTMRATPDLPVRWVSAGLVPYGTAWGWQQELVDRRARDEIPDTLLQLEHPPVYTAGRRADDDNLVFDASERDRRGIELFRVDRGGDFTYHGPGQLVGYPIVRLARPTVVDYVRALEETLIRAVATYGVEAGRVEGYTGVWVGDEKLAAIGVRVSSHYVTSHGFALNVDTRLSDFAGIVPCGIADRGVCSLASLGVEASVADVERRVAAAFGEVFDCTIEDVPLAELSLPVDVPA